MKKGDDISIGASPTIQLVQFALSVKPNAHIHFVAGADPEADMAAAKADLRRGLYEALQDELQFVNDVMERVCEDDTAATIEGLAELCLTEVGYGEEKNNNNEEKDTTAKSHRKRSSE